ncbi:MAG: phosphoribosylformylglycinamidine cyclo-ligase, partial [candidate division Zixibacteria bacterium]|nr:phosphoribosylformylglycinamidine cyclo-ligase [candidate division Zixibacteria bacterium]
NIDPVDIYRTFNMGIGYILVVNAADADAVENEIAARGESVFRIGRITGGAERVVLVE